MENVEIKVDKTVKKAKKKAVKTEAKKEMNAKQMFMVNMNNKRAANKLEMAYSEDEIKAAK